MNVNHKNQNWLKHDKVVSYLFVTFTTLFSPTWLPSHSMHFFMTRSSLQGSASVAKLLGRTQAIRHKRTNSAVSKRERASALKLLWSERLGSGVNICQLLTLHCIVDS